MENKYKYQDYITPLWTGNTVYYESVLFREDVTKVALLYPADEIISVISSDHKTEYIKGEDWELEDGKIVRLPDSKIPLMTLDIFYPEKVVRGESFECIEGGYNGIYFGEGDAMAKWQVDVTYRHSDKWEGPLAKDESAKMQRFYKKLERGEEATIVFYGDSVTVGASSSSFIERDPQIPCFAEFATEIIARKYGYTVSWDHKPHKDNSHRVPIHGEKVLHYVNTAVGGTTSFWGLDNVQELVNDYKPDLVVLGFGGNDGNMKPHEFIELTKKIVDKIREPDPDIEIVILAATIPHWRVRNFYKNQIDFEAVLRELAESSDKMPFVPMTSTHKYLLRKKDFYHMTGNNVNHPNDYLERVYTMVVLRALGLESPEVM